MVNESPSEVIEKKSKSVLSEDLLAILVGWIVLLVSLISVKLVATDVTAKKASNLLSNWIAKPGKWVSSPVDSFFDKDKSLWVGVVGAGLACLLLFGIGALLRRVSLPRFSLAFGAVFILAVLAYMLSGQRMIEAYNLEYVLWALLAGLLISNTVGTPSWIRPAISTEFYIKSGLVLLGAEILFGKLLALGVPGVFVAWVVTPIVLITTFWFGQRVLKMQSPALNMVISADMSVCGVSAAIATASACRAKKEELSLAISMSLTFTVVMMIVMPILVKWMNLDTIVAGAWIGGTIDSTGAVSAAGEALGKEALEVASTVKMIQNILIGVIAFFVAVYWVTFVEKGAANSRVGVGEIWKRFPKFILGFVLASIVFSMIHESGSDGEMLVKATTGVTKTMRGWFFCLGFVCIGLDTNFRELGKQMAGGKPLILYACGQTLNLALTLLMSWLMFKIVFPESSTVLGN